MATYGALPNGEMVDDIPGRKARGSLGPEGINKVDNRRVKNDEGKD